MLQENIIIIFILCLGIVFNNKLIAAAAGILLVLKFLAWQLPIRLLQQNALDIGLLFLLLAVLMPFARGEYTFQQIFRSLLTVPGLLAFLSGIIAAYLCGKGVILLQIRPEVIIGMVIGTLVGVVLFKGIPVGPLAAAGVTALLLNIFGLHKK
ncbi:MAG: DUF441 domain-containing protein [Bacillota bacterium]